MSQKSARAQRSNAQRSNVVRTRRAASLKPFYIGLVVVLLVGIALIARALQHSDASRPSIANVAATPLQAQGHLLGNPNAPVQVLEFADFGCPHCAEFATITEPDIRKRIIDAGLASYRFFDFPIGEFSNSVAASNAAACAGDQNKFWEMHDKLFQGQPDWDNANNPKDVFERYAKALGLDVNAWDACYDSQKHLPEIKADRDEGVRRGVNSTPTFVIGTKQIPGAIPYDMFKAYVDTAAMAAKAASRDTAAPKGASGQP